MEVDRKPTGIYDCKSQVLQGVMKEVLLEHSSDSHLTPLGRFKDVSLEKMMSSRDLGMNRGAGCGEDYAYEHVESSLH